MSAGIPAMIFGASSVAAGLAAMVKTIIMSLPGMMMMRMMVMVMMMLGVKFL